MHRQPPELVVVGHDELAPSAAKPRLLDQVGAAIRARHYARRTERAYVGWVRRFILYNGKRHPDQLGGAEVTAFLTSLATERRVSASTQNQALAAILFCTRRYWTRSSRGWAT